MMDNLDGFQKLVSTRWTFSISISIGLERRDPQAFNFDILDMKADWFNITFSPLCRAVIYRLTLPFILCF